MDFSTMDIATLTHSVTGEGVRYLELFLKEYLSLFGGPLNPQCPACLTEYLNRYKNHYKQMDTPTTKYRLHAKYENIPLEFGSPILVNNGNLTEEYAQKLLEQPDGQRFFAVLPQKKEMDLENEEVTVPQPKARRKRILKDNGQQ